MDNELKKDYIIQQNTELDQNITYIPDRKNYLIEKDLNEKINDMEKQLGNFDKVKQFERVQCQQLSKLSKYLVECDDTSNQIMERKYLYAGQKDKIKQPDQS